MAKQNYLGGLRVTGQEIDRICNDIIANDEHQTPIVGEDVFISQVLTLLQRPWDPRNQDIYRRYVKELTMPLRVAGVRDGETFVLFTVPPLHARVDTSMGGIHDITAAHFVNQADLIRTRGSSEPVDQYISEFLQMISMTVPVEHSTLVPIAGILSLYERTFLDDEGNPLYSLDGSVPINVSGSKPVAEGDVESFESYGYLDEE